MQLKDLCYFSRGERNALIVLLGLMATAWIALIYTSDESPSPATAPQPLATTDTLSATAPDSLPATRHHTSTKSTTTQRMAKAPQTWPRLPKQATYPRTSEKFSAGTIIELNEADTLTLKKIPGIGSTFARRIVRYRELLGGYYTVEQLAEVYGIDEERYAALYPWFRVYTTRLRPQSINQLSYKELLRHPYLNNAQVRQIDRLRRKAPLQSWSELMLLEEFTDLDIQRLRVYFTFQ